MKGDSFGAKLYTGHIIVQYFNRLKFSLIIEQFVQMPNLNGLVVNQTVLNFALKKITELRRKNDARQRSHYINWYLSSWQHW